MADIDGWAKAAVDRIVADGLMSKDANDLFRGQDPITRQETAVVLDRLLDRIHQEIEDAVA